LVALVYLFPTSGTHRGLSPKTTLSMPPKLAIPNPDEGLFQAFSQN
jgi:hypothetical protein